MHVVMSSKNELKKKKEKRKRPENDVAREYNLALHDGWTFQDMPYTGTHSLFVRSSFPTTKI